MADQPEKIYFTSVGKVILAHLPPEIRQNLIDSIVLEPVTPQTIASKEVLIENLEQIVKMGYAIDDEENIIGVRCIAAPIRNFRGKINYCIGISGPTMRMETNMIPKYAEMVKAVAEKISSKLGYKIEERTEERVKEAI